MLKEGSGHKITCSIWSSCQLAKRRLP